MIRRPALHAAAIVTRLRLLPFALLPLLAFTRPIDHDESQYVAAARLAHDLLPYRDFDYLQTPGQLLLSAPLAFLTGDYALLFLRLGNAILIAASLLIAAQTMRRLGASIASAGLCTFALFACEPLLFAGTTARNDALPCLLLTIAIAVLAEMDGEGPAPHREAGLAGLLLGAAAMTKLSYAVPCLAPIAAELWWRRRQPARLTLWTYCLGVAVPILLTALVAQAAPARFWFDVVTFPTAAPREYYLAAEGSFRLSLAGRLFDFAKFLCLGAAPVLLMRLLRERRETPDWIHLQLLALIAGGIVAALLPAPVWRQYLVPALPPLAILAARSSRAWSGRWRIALVPFLAAGLSFTAIDLGWTLAKESPVLAAERDAHRLGASLRAAEVRRPIVSLAPELIADAGLPLDPRFAAGPFLFRTHDGLGQGFGLAGVTQSTIDRLAVDPPGAIIVGGEAITAGQPALDRRLEDWALRHHYRALPEQFGGLRLLLPPA